MRGDAAVILLKRAHLVTEAHAAGGALLGDTAEQGFELHQREVGGAAGAVGVITGLKFAAAVAVEVADEATVERPVATERGSKGDALHQVRGRTLAVDLVGEPMPGEDLHAALVEDVRARVIRCGRIALDQ